LGVDKSRKERLRYQDNITDLATNFLPQTQYIDIGALLTKSQQMALRSESWYYKTQKLFNNQPTIRFGKNHSIKSLDDVIYWGIIKGKPTYFSNDDNRAQCTSGRRRSAEDIYLLCRHYNVDVTLKNIDSALSVLACEGIVLPPSHWIKPSSEREFYIPLQRNHCSQVKRMVHSPSYERWEKVTKTKFKEIITNVRNRNNTGS